MVVHPRSHNAPEQTSHDPAGRSELERTVEQRSPPPKVRCQHHPHVRLRPYSPSACTLRRSAGRTRRSVGNAPYAHAFRTPRRRRHRFARIVGTPLPQICCLDSCSLPRSSRLRHSPCRGGCTPPSFSRPARLSRRLRSVRTPARTVRRHQYRLCAVRETFTVLLPS